MLRLYPAKRPKLAQEAQLHVRVGAGMGAVLDLCSLARANDVLENSAAFLEDALPVLSAQDVDDALLSLQCDSDSSQ